MLQTVRGKQHLWDLLQIANSENHPTPHGLITMTAMTETTKVPVSWSRLVCSRVFQSVFGSSKREKRVPRVSFARTSGAEVT